VISTSKGQSYYDWEESFKHNHTKEAIGISSEEFEGFLNNWKSENLYSKKDQAFNQILVLDIETTGFKPYSDMICEIGICALNLDNGKVEPVFHIICQEENKKIDDSSWIFQNSDLSIYSVRNAQYLEEFRDTLQKSLIEHPCTAYNQRFDFSFLEARGFKIPKKFWDPMHKLTPILKILKYDGAYKWPSVQEAYDYFFPKEKYVERHRALDDAKHEAKIIYATYKLLKERGKT